MLNKQGRIYFLALVLTIMGCMAVVQPVAAADFGGAAPVSDAQLAHLRGGFDVGGGQVKLSFGIKQLSFINGELVAVTNLDAPAANAVNVVQNGTGNFVNPGLGNEMASGTLATVIQNSLDGQTIGNLNLYNINVTSLQAAHSLSVHNAIADALARGSAP